MGPEDTGQEETAFVLALTKESLLFYKYGTGLLIGRLHHK